MNKNEPYNFVWTVKHFADAFKKFRVAQKLHEEVAVPFEKSRGHQKALVKTNGSLSQWDLLKTTFKK